MSTNGKVTSEERQEKALYQRGQAVANEARQVVSKGADTGIDQYSPTDVIAAMFYMHRQTIGDVGRELGRVLDSADESIQEDVSVALNEMLQRKGPSKDRTQTDE